MMLLDMHMWERRSGQSVEDALRHNRPCDLKLRSEHQGESIAFRDNEKGFVTTSDNQKYAPIYYYGFR